MFALIDCNCFFVSCERLFSPSLEGRAVAVLSGHGGCIVSCSPEMKLLGARVGDPWFMVKKLPGMQSALVLNANIELYQDMSRRVMRTLARFEFPMELYSIDEAFIALPQSMDAPARLAWARQAAADCKACGIPVSIGIGSTKTRAKLSNSWAKPSRGGDGHCDWDGMDDDALLRLMCESPCSDVWGVGPKSFNKLELKGIHSVLDLARADPTHLRHLGTSSLSTCGAELRGEIVHTFSTRRAQAQSIMRSRTFERPVPLLRELGEAISHFASAAAFHLRASGLLARQGEVFISTHPLDRLSPPRSASIRFLLDAPSDDSLVFGSAAAQALASCFQAGYAYRRAGLVLSLISANSQSLPAQSANASRPTAFRCIQSEADALACGASEPFGSSTPALASHSARGRAGLMAVMDQINAKHGRDALRLASAKLPQPQPTPRCPTTRLADVPIAKAL